MKVEKDNRSAIWGGGTIGLIIGLIIWLVSGDSEKIIWSVLIGIAIGIIATLLGKLSDRLK